MTDNGKITTREEFGRLLNKKAGQKYGSIDNILVNLSFDYQRYYTYKNGRSFPRYPQDLDRICEKLGINQEDLDLSSLVSKKYYRSFGLKINGTSQDQVPKLDASIINESKPQTELKHEMEYKPFVYNIGENSEHGLIVGKSQEMKSIFIILGNIIKNPDQEQPVLITGETGTGKELIAKAVHYNSNRKNSPFFPINITNINENLLESQLFGSRKGAYTDAREDSIGFFEETGNGTIFLDEISNMPLEAQAKLLRVLESRTFYRVGDTKSRQFNGRIIVATNENLEKLVESRKFRQDLFYRLNVVDIDLSSLRDRKDDIGLLFNYFVCEYNNKYKTSYLKEPTDKGKELLQSYNFPGNVRELKNLIYKAIFNFPESESVLVENYIQIKDLKFKKTQKSDFNTEGIAFADSVISYFEIDNKSKFEIAELRVILEAAFNTKVVMIKTAELLEISRKTLWLRLENFGVSATNLKQYYLQYISNNR